MIFLDLQTIFALNNFGFLRFIRFLRTRRFHNLFAKLKRIIRDYVKYLDWTNLGSSVKDKKPFENLNSDQWGSHLSQCHKTESILTKLSKFKSIPCSFPSHRKLKMQCGWWSVQEECVSFYILSFGFILQIVWHWNWEWIWTLFG